MGITSPSLHWEEAWDIGGQGLEASASFWKFAHTACNGMEWMDTEEVCIMYSMYRIGRTPSGAETGRRLVAGPQ